MNFKICVSRNFFFFQFFSVDPVEHIKKSSEKVLSVFKFLFQELKTHFSCFHQILVWNLDVFRFQYFFIVLRDEKTGKFNQTLMIVNDFCVFNWTYWHNSVTSISRQVAFFEKISFDVHGWQVKCFAEFLWYFTH